MPKLLIAILLILPGGFLLAPALMLWLRRARRRQLVGTEAQEPTPQIAGH